MHLDKTAGRVWTHLQTQRLLVSPRLLDLVQIPAFRTNALTAAPPPPPTRHVHSHGLDNCHLQEYILTPPSPGPQIPIGRRDCPTCVLHLPP